MSYIYDRYDGEADMTNYPAGWMPEFIPSLEELVELGGYLACPTAIPNPVWGIGGSERDAEDDCKSRVFKQLGNVPNRLGFETRHASQAAVAAARKGEYKTIVLDELLDRYVYADEVEIDNRKIADQTNRWKSWIDSRKVSWPTGDQGELHREMMVEMAWAYAKNSTARLMISEGRPVWRPFACPPLNLPDTHWRIHDIVQELSQDVYRAAEEIKVCLGISKWLEDIEPAPRHRLREVGEAIWGAEWVSPLARTVGVAVRTAQRWASGDSPVPEYVFEALAPTISESKLKLRQRLEVLERV
jgi:hypothetical protein